MSTQIKQKTVDVLFTNDANGKLMGNVVPKNQEHKKADKVLRLHFSLMGESAPVLSPLSADYSFDGKTSVYRYDWTVGVTLFRPYYGWNWWDEIAANRAMIVQLLLDPGESGCGFTETTALLLGLTPSKDTASWFDRNSEKLSESLAKLSDIAEPFSKIASNLMKTSSVMSNFIASEGKEQKNWFLYRFLDEERKCCAVEWNISRNVIHQYGPLLRGSIFLAFHGGQKPQKPLTLLLRPLLNFSKDHMDFSPPFEQLEKTDPVALSINPILPD